MNMYKSLVFAAVGGLVGFWVGKTKYEKAAYAYANERIEQAKVYAEERAEREIQKARAEAVEVVTARYEEDESALQQDLTDNPAVEKLILNYGGFSSPAPATVKPEEEDSESHIVLMRRKEFFEGPEDGYDQAAVTYYILDHILIDERDKQLDVSAAVGDIRPDWFGNEADDENVCYVRNTKINIEFEVNRSLESYAKDVLGVGDNGPG